jgi:hypothetical protein
MPLRVRSSLAPHSHYRRRVRRPRLEPLECRQLMAGSPALPGTTVLLEPKPNDTLDVAQSLGDLSGPASSEVIGTIANNSTGSADVDWYGFTLDRPASVNLSVSQQSTSPSFRPVVSLYNSDPFDFGDLYDRLGHRLLVQDDATSHTGPATIDRLLGAGSYFVAVSGAGNANFHPMMADTGLPGQTGGYNLSISTADLGGQPGDGPAVLTAEPAPGAVLDTSPLVIRIGLSGPLDPCTIIAGQNVRMIFSPGGTFSQDGQDVTLASVNFSGAINELQLFPARALAPGEYEVVLAGQSDPASFSLPLADPTAIPLGADVSHPLGQDFAYSFRVDGIEGNTATNAAADDTPATAHNLGDVTEQGIVRVDGVIGADPFYDSLDFDPGSNPGNDVNLYHFQVHGPGRFALAAEVFAGRIGSPLDPGLSLYRLAGDGHTLRFVEGDNNTYNPAQTTDLNSPLLTDSALFAGLTDGDYYLAVSTAWNTPSPAEGQPVDAQGLFDPTISHSGSLGFGTGPYVLTLLVQPASNPPRVIDSSPVQGATLDTSPRTLTVQFNEPVNLRQMAFAAYQQETQEDALPAVYVQDNMGVKYFPRLVSYDPASNTATFLMLDRLPSGPYGLHLSGPAGLADLGGNPISGNGSNADFVIEFQVQAADPGLVFDRSTGFHLTFPMGMGTALDLGVLYPHELQAGITLDRAANGNPASDPSASGDQFRFQVLQERLYSFLLTGDNVPAGIQLTVTDDSGNPVSTDFPDQGQNVLLELSPGTYRIEVSGWDPNLGDAVPYQLQLTLQTVFDNPPPLVSGPTPAVVMHFESTTMTGPPPIFDTGGSHSGPSNGQGGTGTGADDPQGNVAGVSGLGTTSTAGLSGLAVGTGSLGFLASGPMGGVASSSQFEAEPATLQLAISTPSSPGQGLLTLFVMTLTGTMSTPLTPAAKPQDGNLTDQDSDRNDGQATEQQVLAVAHAEAPRVAGTPSRTEIQRDDEVGPIQVADAQESQVPALDTVMVDETLWDDDRAPVFSGSLAGIPFNETSEALAGLLPDWVGYIAAAGILVLSLWKTARRPRWTAKSDPAHRFGENRFHRAESEPSELAPHAARHRGGWFRRRHEPRHLVTSALPE